MQNNELAWIDKFITDKTLCAALDNSINVFKVLPDTSNKVLEYAIKTNKSNFIDLTRVLVSNPRRTKPKDKKKALAQFAAKVLNVKDVIIKEVH